MGCREGIREVKSQSCTGSTSDKEQKWSSEGEKEKL